MLRTPPAVCIDGYLYNMVGAMAFPTQKQCPGCDSCGRAKLSETLAAAATPDPDCVPSRRMSTNRQPDWANNDDCIHCGRTKINTGPHELTCGRDECLAVVYSR